MRSTIPPAPHDSGPVMGSMLSKVVDLRSGDVIVVGNSVRTIIGFTAPGSIHTDDRACIFFRDSRGMMGQMYAHAETVFAVRAS